MTALLLNEKASVGLLAGHSLTVVAASDFLWSRCSSETVLDSGAGVSGETKVFGEYPTDQIIHPTCFDGTLGYTSSFDLSSGVTQTNDEAPAGAIGEYKSAIKASTSPVTETTNTPIDVITLALTAGDWDVSGVVNRSLTGVTATRYAAAISPTADTIPAQAGGSGVAADSVVVQFATFGETVTGGYTTLVGPVRVSLASPATIHLVAADLFSAGTLTLNGSLRARRVR